MFQNIKYQILFLTLISSYSFSQSERQRIEIPTDKGCAYVEFISFERVESRKQSEIMWSGNCLGNFINGEGTLTIKAIDGINQKITTVYKNGLENGDGESILEGPKGKIKFTGSWKDGFKVKGTREVEPVGGMPFKYVGEFSNGKYNGYGKFERGNYIHEGVFKDGIAEGKGKRTFSNGDTYEGDFKNNKRDGYGIYKFANGTVYEGNHVEDKFQGQGKFIFVNGLIMIGEFKDGQLHRGQKIYSNGILDEGEFLISDLNGEGVRKYPDGRTDSGTFLNGKLNGKVIIKYQNGDYYEGDAVNDMKSGKGIYKISDGRIYEGDFLDNKATGFGILKYPNGRVYEGKFENNLQNGFGSVKFTSGEVQEGVFKDGVIDGAVKITYSSGSFMDAIMIKGKLNGTATFTSSNGDKWYIEYKDGVKVSQTAASNNKQVTQVPQPAYTPSPQTSQINQRQQGIDSMNCEAYANNSTANQQPITSNAVSAIMSGLLIGMNKQDYYDSCMKRLGY